MNLHINDFCPEHYKEVLDLMASKYVFSTFLESTFSNRSLILRHDLDLDLTAAGTIAAMEAERGIKANYFLLLRSPFYNPLEKTNYQQVQRIKALGHVVGIHLDIKFYEVSAENDLIAALETERKIFVTAFGIEPEVFTFHLTNPVSISFDKEAYAGLINGFSKRFRSDFDYCSDSYGLWRFERLKEFLERNHDKPLHVLTHPEWWVYPPSSPVERLEKVIGNINTKLWEDAGRNYIFQKKAAV